MQEPKNETMPDPIDFVPGQKLTTEANNSAHAPLAMSRDQPSKTRNKILKGITLLLFIPIAAIGLVIVWVLFSVTSHMSELNKLKDETTALFDSSTAVPSSYDCHDVELRNTCYIQFNNKNEVIESLLVREGFQKNDTYGDGYVKGNLYVVDSGNGLYSSFYAREY